MTSDELISMIKACEAVIETDAQLDNVTDMTALVLLRDGVKNLAVVQRDLLRSILKGG